MMKPLNALVPLLALGCALGLQGCGKKEASEAQASSAAKLLPRSTTDDMPPYDTVQSKAAPADPEATDDAGDMTTGTSATAKPSDAPAPAPSTPAAEAGDAPVTPDAE